MVLEKPDIKLITRLFFRLLPFQILLAAIASVNGIVSSLFATNYVGAEAMSAIGLFAPITMFLQALNAMLVGGSMLLCGQYMGKNQLDRTRNIYAMNIVISLVICMTVIVVCVLGVVTGFTRTMTDDPVVLQQLNRYTLGMMIGIVPTVLSQQVSAFLSLENQTKRTTMGSVAFIVVNLILHAVLIGFLHMDALGLALAASIGQWIFLGVLAQYYTTGKSTITAGWKGLRTSDSFAILKIGYPGGLSFAYQTLRGFIVNGLIVAYVGSIGLSAFAACNTFLNIFWSIPIGMVTVSRMLIGISIGEEDRKSLTDIMRVMFWRCVPLMCVISAILILCAVPLTNLYYQNPADPVYAMTVSGFRILPICMPLSIVCMHFVCYAQASGKQVLVHILSVLDGVVCVAGFTALLIPFLGINAVYHANTLNGLTCIAVVVLYSCICNKKFPSNMEELMVIPENFGVEEKDRIDITVTDLSEVVKVSQQVSDFCKEHNVDSHRSYFASLALEEMAGNVVDHGFKKDKKSHSVDIRVALKGEDIIMRIKDDCIPFNPKERMELIDPENEQRYLGIQLAYKAAKAINYQNILGLNVLTIRV